ncbi:helix-turn-helix protein [Kineococcus xinjiangensis]|uniref:Helix-turn-helix protein n=1 Tax=Kineococcus xinjiangensis TaxID=512762 RepID=A0A2S6IJ54_9ACTN|nr:helix-turn-helix transcriptional regulator [Kineococcus xinjiangensis]PPK94228.1 helix-turn-helix protein [Kineococcus xinjiangensis]
MANDRLRSTLHSNGYNATKLGEELGVDPKTVQRWVTKDRSPHRNTANRAAKLLGVPANWLWPDLEKADSAETSGEVVNFYAHRSQVPKNCWLEQVIGAKERIDFLTYASLFLGEANPEAIDIIKHKAANGVKVRIALGDPDSPEIARRGEEEGLGEAIAGRIRMALAYYRPLVGAPGVEFSLHRTTLYNSIYRFDDQMLVNQHILGTYGYVAPILHLRKIEGSDLFDTYARSLDLAWSQAYSYAPA